MPDLRHRLDRTVVTAMAQTPALPAEWPPTPGQLAMLATTAHWQLEALAWDLPRGEVTRERLDTTAAAMEALAALLRRHQPGS